MNWIWLAALLLVAIVVAAVVVTSLRARSKKSAEAPDDIYPMW